MATVLPDFVYVNLMAWSRGAEAGGSNVTRPETAPVVTSDSVSDRLFDAFAVTVDDTVIPVPLTTSPTRTLAKVEVVDNVTTPLAAEQFATSKGGGFVEG